MIVLNGSDIEKCIELKGMIHSIEKAIRTQESGNFYMPDRMHIDYNDTTLLLMPSFSEIGFGTKLVTVFAENRQLGLPPIFGTMVYNDIKTGKPLAIFEGSSLTAHRTGALGGFAASILAKKNTQNLGIIGAGVQSFHQAIYICSVLNINNIHLFDTSLERMNHWKTDITTKIEGVEVQLAQNTREIVEKSELIVTATTSEKPVINCTPELMKEKIFLAFGSYKPIMQEIPDNIFLLNPVVFVDTEHAKKETGDLVIPMQKGLLSGNNIYTLGKLVNNEIKLRAADTIIFKSVGMALFDLMVSQYLYQKAVENNIGVVVDF